jgi:hypothetical protein
VWLVSVGDLALILALVYVNATSTTQRLFAYLLAPVKVVAEFDVYNIKARSIEKLLHSYFDKARAEITFPDRFGKPVKSREWFMVPRSAIKEAVDRLIDCSLGDTVYDPLSARLMPKRKAADEPGVKI